MSAEIQTKPEAVAGGRLATSAQPTRATPTLELQNLAEVTPNPIRSFSLCDNPGALRVSLHCLTASRPLNRHTLLGGKAQQNFRSHSFTNNVCTHKAKH